MIMKAGLTLTQLAQEIERQSDSKRDFIVPASKLEMYVAQPVGDAKPKTAIALLGGDGQTRAVRHGEGISEHAHSQLAEYAGIPIPYYRKMAADQPTLLAHNVNTWLRAKPANDARLVRTLDGSMRALLSDRYRPLDNFDLMQAILPELMGLNGIRVESTQVTETRLYIKAVFPKIEGEIRKGDVVQSGIVISNSEVGAGSLQVSPLVFRLVCLNGMIAQDYGTRRAHVGKRLSAEDQSFELLSNETRTLDDAAFFSKVKDIVRGTLKQDVFQKITDSMRAAAEQPLEVANISEIVEVTSSRFGYNEKTKAGILTHLIQGADMTRYGLMNAITRQSQDEADYDVATRLEADGHRVIELPKTQWQEILKQAA
jgi:hypothetical protein